MSVSRPTRRRDRATRRLAWFHRWLGIATCLVFALWFASGAVLLFRPFPSLAPAAALRLAAPVDFGAVGLSPRAAAAAAGAPVTALRLVQRGDAPAYLATTVAGTIAIDARTGRRLDDIDPAAATAAAARGMPGGRIAAPAFAYDQWVVHNRFDPLRPFYAVQARDAAGTTFYLSARTGEFVQRTDRADRAWNWIGAVLHWAYFTPLRASFTAWDRTVWILSLVALLVAIAGTILGVVRTLAARRQRRPALTFYRLRWMRWHHLLGLFASVFVLGWMFSGWLSMDHGRLFSRGQPTAGQAARYQGARLAEVLPDSVPAGLPPATRRIAYTVAGGRPIAVAAQPDGTVRTTGGDGRPLDPAVLRRSIGTAAARAFAASGVRSVTPIDPTATYALAEGWPASAVRVMLAGPGLPDLYADGADGRLLTVMDDSRARYAWIYYALHTFNFPGLTTRPVLRRILVLVPLVFGFLFSITGVVIGVQRLRKSLRSRSMT